MSRRKDSLGIYVSVPFCASKCSYCNFASGVFAEDTMTPYVGRLVEELEGSASFAERLGAGLPRKVDTIYFGGGTPSLLPPGLFQQIAAAIRGNFDVDPQVEWTVECAPGQLSEASLHAMVAAGVNRLSFGVQSFEDRETAVVGRLHTSRQTEASIRLAKDAAVANINVDLLAGLPRQTHDSWKRSLTAALALDVPHISVYMLEVDEDSRLGRELIIVGDKYHARDVPDDDAIADFYGEACARLNGAGIAQYEISNFSKAGYESRHNDRYWEREAYLGVGLDAHSCLYRADGDAVRAAGTDTMAAYLAGHRPTEEVAGLARRLEEAWFLGLRRNRGVNSAELRHEFGEIADAAEAAADTLVSDGLILRDDNIYRLSERGRMISNEVFARFVTIDDTVCV